jgi:opacity protein-like surface antigen
MKKISLVLLVVFSVAFAGFAEAAKPKKRTRNANRIGAYGVGFIGQSKYTSDQTGAEAFAVDQLENLGDASQNISVSTEDTDIGYNATFGYRFNRYFAAELGLAQVGSVESKARGQVDFGDGSGFTDASMTLGFSTGGVMFSAIGILPINDSFEFFGRAGYMFTSTERELSLRIDGESGGFGSAKGDSQEVVLGLGAAYHFNQVYSLRFEYLKLDEVGEDRSTGVEDLHVLGLGVVVRF